MIAIISFVSTLSCALFTVTMYNLFHMCICIENVDNVLIEFDNEDLNEDQNENVGEIIDLTKL